MTGIVADQHISTPGLYLFDADGIRVNPAGAPSGTFAQQARDRQAEADRAADIQWDEDHPPEQDYGTDQDSTSSTDSVGPELDDEEFAFLLEGAAGVYLIDQATADIIVETTPNDLGKARTAEVDGEIVIGPDGSVSGEVWYKMTSVGDENYVSWDWTELRFEPTVVSQLDDGLYFETTVVTVGGWGAENIAPDRVDRYNDYQAKSYVDVDIGQIIVTGVIISIEVATINFAMYN